MQLVYDYPEALLKAKRPRDAAAFLDRELARFPDDGPLHRIAAQAYAELGKKMQKHRHQGEYYAWQGDSRGRSPARNRIEGRRRRFLPGFGRRGAAAHAAP